MRLLRVPLCLAALLCSGCELGLSVDIDVDRNGGGQVAVAVTADAELQELAEEADADPLGDLVTAGEALDGWAVDDAGDETGGRRVSLTSEFADPAEFEALMGQLSSTLAADEADLLEPFTLTVSDERIAVAGGASAQPKAAVRDYGLNPNQAVRLLKRTEAFDYDISVSLPGEVLDSNATQAQAGDLAWNVPPGQRVVITAAGTRPGPPLLRAALGAAGGAAVAGGVLWLVARRRRLERG